MYHYDFITEEEAVVGLNNKIIKLNYDEDKYIFMENDAYLFYQYNSNIFIYDKESDGTYYVDEENKTKQLLSSTSSLNINEEIIYALYRKIFAAHLKIADSNFKKLDTQKDIADITCDIYEYDQTSNKSGKIERYYVDSISGRCLKYEIDYQLDDTTDNLTWEITSFIENEEQITLTIDQYLNYENEYTNYSSYPSTPLASMILEVPYGEFYYAMDNGTNFMCSYRYVSQYELNVYLTSIDTTLFTNAKKITIESGQFYYKAYTSDYILLEINYYSQTLSISITKSNAEDIAEAYNVFS
jgi:hypothetical protein